jgi:hypothetical protein
VLNWFCCSSRYAGVRSTSVDLIQAKAERVPSAMKRAFRYALARRFAAVDELRCLRIMAAHQVKEYLPWKTNSRSDSTSVDLFLKIGFQAHARVGPAFGLVRPSSISPEFGRCGSALCRIVSSGFLQDATIRQTLCPPGTDHYGSMCPGDSQIHRSRIDENVASSRFRFIA